VVYVMSVTRRAEGEKRGRDGHPPARAAGRDGRRVSHWLVLKQAPHMGLSPRSTNPPWMLVLHAQQRKWPACQYLEPHNASGEVPRSQYR
jgi:hypothetical protein